MRPIPVFNFVPNWSSVQAQGLVAWWPPVAVGKTTNSYLAEILSGQYASISAGTPSIVFDSSLGNVVDYGGVFSVGSVRRIAGLVDWSITAWVITDVTNTSGGFGRPIYNERSSGNELLKFQLSDGFVVGAGTLQYIYRDTTGTLNRDGTTVTLTIGTTYHVACVKKGTNIKIYIDAVNRADKTLTATDTLTTVNFNSIGGDSSLPASAFWDGRIGDLRLYNKSLSEQEIYALYNSETRWEMYQQIGKVWPVAALAIGLARSQVVIIG